MKLFMIISLYEKNSQFYFEPTNHCIPCIRCCTFASRVPNSNRMWSPRRAGFHRQPHKRLHSALSVYIPHFLAPSPSYSPPRPPLTLPPHISPCTLTAVRRRAGGSQGRPRRQCQQGWVSRPPADFPQLNQGIIATPRRVPSNFSEPALGRDRKLDSLPHHPSVFRRSVPPLQWRCSSSAVGSPLPRPLSSMTGISPPARTRTYFTASATVDCDRDHGI
jgi:hypothetical protein